MASSGFFSNLFFLHEEKVHSDEDKAKRLIANGEKDIRRATHKLQSEDARLKNKYKESIAKCKLATRAGESASIIMSHAKTAVTIQKQRERCVRAKLLLESSSARILQVKSTSTLTNALKTSTMCLTLMNRCYPIAEFSQMMKKYEHEENTAQMMEEQIEEAFEMDEGDDTEIMVDDVMQRVMDEVGLDLSKKISTTVNAPSKFDKNFDRAWNECEGSADALIERLMAVQCPSGRPDGRDGSNV